MPKTNRIEELRKLIVAARKAYYNGDEPLFTDSEYDALEAELRQLSPDDKIFAEIGTDAEDDTTFPKEKHSILMGSQSKCANETEFEDWWRLHNTDNDAVIATYKVDGASLALYYENGKLVKALTRGDGKIGRNITPNAVKFFGVPSTIKSSGKASVRGEVLLTVANWRKIDPAALNPRNLGTGIMSREDGENCDMLRFIAFDIEEEKYTFKTEEQKLRRIIELGFQATFFQMCGNLQEAINFYSDTMLKRKDSAIQLFKNEVWIDGLVMKINPVDTQKKLGESSGCPKWSTAVKFPSPGAETYIEGFELQVGNMGTITPVARVKTVEIGGTNVTNVMLNNWDFIAIKDVAVGDKVLITKGGDIIPVLKKVIDRPANRKAIEKPTKCPVCGGRVGHNLSSKNEPEVALSCQDEYCPMKLIGKINRIVNKLEIMDVGDAIIAEMCKSGIIKKIGDLFCIEQNRKAIATLNVGNGIWGDKRTQTMIDEVSKKTSMPLDMFLGILGVKGLGQRRAKIIIDKLPNDMGTIEDWQRNTLIQKSSEAGVPGIAKNICASIQTMENDIKDMLSVVTIIAPQKKAVVIGKLTGKSFCLTGEMSRPRSAIAKDIEAAGGEVHSSVSKNTTCLVQADVSSKSSKTQKADKYGVKIIDEDELMGMME